MNFFTIIFVALLINIDHFLLNKRIFFPRNQYRNDNKKGMTVNFIEI